jgi:predicted Abi (CAAX) family protease
MADQLTILKLMAKLDVDTAITFLQELANDMYDVNDDYARIVMYCNDLQGQYRPSNNDEAPWKAVRDKIASMDLQNGYNDTELVIDSMVQNINSNQMALLNTLAFGEQTASYNKGALDMYHHLGWKD